MVIKWYHVFGSGSGMVYFRPTRADFKPFRDFFAAAKSAATEDGNWGTWPDIIYMTEEIQLQIQPLTKDLEKELVARFLAIQEYRTLQRRLPK